MSARKKWYVYIIECAGGKWYTGITTDLRRRLAEHRSGKGSRFTRAFGAKKLVYTQEQPDRSCALKREAAIKRLKKSEKRSLAQAEGKRRRSRKQAVR
ncbi:MAG: GIY-YIG nuclease family protein [Endomicrobiales bacterium]